jgi:phosphatidylglycerol:prolipoprotein diacylglycerol transferase
VKLFSVNDPRPPSQGEFGPRARQHALNRLVFRTSVPEPFLVHRIDPVIGTLFGAHLWWYGLSYSLGFLNAHVFLRRHRARLGLSRRQVDSLTLWLAAGVLIGGRGLVVFNHEWSFYRESPALIPALWVGGLATHGLLAGGFAGVFAFCVVHRLPFRPVFDALAIPAALIMGFGRLGNFIDGQIVGRVTDVPWAVQFPEAEGFRHPVVLYDGLKNFLIVPVLAWGRQRGAPPGRLAALFVVLYAGLRIPIDLFREYPVNPLGLPTGQGFNAIMTGIGVVLLIRNWLRNRHDPHTAPFPGPAARVSRGSVETDESPGWRRAAFAAILCLSLLIPSDATRDIPRKYGHRHAGLDYSWMYPPMTTVQP